jgi:hypothetical protein
MEPRHERIARIALAAGARYGLALAGGYAVSAHGMGNRPRWWLNEQASSYVAPGGDPAASRVFDHPGLRVFAASPEHLLAMKALAARPRGIFPEEEPPERLRLLLEDIFSDEG